MGQEQLHSQAFEQRFYASDETVYATWVRPAATDAFKALQVTIDAKQAQRPRRDNRVTRGDYELILGDLDVSWTAKGFLVPSGAAGTAPDWDIILRTALGARTTVGGVSVTYDPSFAQGDYGSFSLHRWAAVSGELAYGCWVDNFKLTVNGSDEPRVEASGGASNYVFTGASTIPSGTTSANQTVASADQNSFMANSLVRIGANTNSGTGFRVVSRAGAVLTLESSMSSTTADDVLPYMPLETTAGSPASGIDGSLTLDGTNYGAWTAFEMNVKNNMKPQRHALNAYVQDYTEGWQEVTGTVTVKMRRDMARLLGWRLNAITTARDVQLIIGSVAGSIITVNMDRTRLEGGPINFPEGADEAEVQIPWKALESTASSSDGFNIAFT